MNLLQAEDDLKAMLPQTEYLRHVALEREDEGEKEFDKYMDLKERIHNSKDRYRILPLEYNLETLKERKEFYDVDILPMLYKDFISDESIEYCKKKTKELEDEINTITKAIHYRKGIAIFGNTKYRKDIILY